MNTGAIACVLHREVAKLALQLDLDEDELAGVGVDDVVLDAGVAIVGRADGELRSRVAGGAPDGERATGHRHDDVGVLVTVVAGAGTGREAPLGGTPPVGGEPPGPA